MSEDNVHAGKPDRERPNHGQVGFPRVPAASHRAMLGKDLASEWRLLKLENPGLGAFLSGSHSRFHDLLDELQGVEEFTG